ncbi:MAG: hypothetical protein ACMUEL_01665 [Flavobacteriales bacterium Tduv]
MLLLIYWYDFSDVGTEEFVKEYLSCMRFCYRPIGRLEPKSYDSMQILSTRIIAKKKYDCLLKNINKELEKH